MSIRNALLCGLIGHEVGAASSPDGSWARTPEDTLLHAMHLVASDRLNEVAPLCRQNPDLDVESLAHYCLFLGLTRNVGLAARAFDVLKATVPRARGIWLNSAYLQAVCRHPTAAARSIAVHAMLTGRQPPKLDLPVEGAGDFDAGSIRFMPGDVPMLLPEGDDA